VCRSVLAILCLLFATYELRAQEAVAASPGPAPNETEEGFVSLFDGKTLEGWQGSLGGYVAEDGLLVCQPKGGGKLFTTKEYGNFILRFEFRLEPGGNNGIAIRSPLEGRPSRDGMEIQILDDDHPKYAKLGPYQYHGSIYGMVPAKRGHLKPPGEWNCEEIVCDGSRIKVTLNGTVIVDADLHEITDPTMDGREHPGRHREKGFLGFIGHGTRVEFRNIRVKELQP
jgi:hypothetical protein